MPASYAHYRFGQKLTALLPPEQQRLIRHFRQLYLAGLQGPDVFFYHNAVVKTGVVRLGDRLHRMSGVDFFEDACAAVSSDGSKAYLLGLLAHYCLDSVCHPFVHAHTDTGEISHVELETEFDRYLLKLDGNPSPHTVDRGAELHLTAGECETAAAFYPQIKPEDMRRSVRHMASNLRLLATPKPGRRKLLGKLMAIPGGQLRHHLMRERRNTACSHLDEEMLTLFNGALELYPVLLEQLQDYLYKNIPLGADFDPEFG